MRSKNCLWFLIVVVALIFIGAFFIQNKASAYGDCSKYGYMAMYDILTDSCKCMSGYVFKEDSLLGTRCVSGDTVCHDKYGYNSRYNSLDKSCECDYGYVFGKDITGRTQCVSLDSICTDQLGYNARYNSLYDKCECRSGYVISDGRCTDGGTVCYLKHGLYSSYDYFSNTCECNSGYTFDSSNQCVKKQNNVYFTLKELDTDERKAIIRSDYDYGYYLISYNSGCYSSSFRRYLNNQIVVNLGTDFDLDTWDKIVLQDDHETCDITHVERVDSNTSLRPEEDIIVNFVPQPTVVIPSQPIETPTKSIASPPNATPTIQEKNNSAPKTDSNGYIPIQGLSKISTSTKSMSTTSLPEEISTQNEKVSEAPKPGLFARVFGSIKNFFLNIFR